MVQCLLSHALKIPSPLTGANEFNYGITVTISGNTYQIFKATTWCDRIQQQTNLLPEEVILDIAEKPFSCTIKNSRLTGYFPLHDLPADACFVIRHSELEKLIHIPAKNNPSSPIPTRISTPLSRLFWLACKHNEDISPLIRQPYKLLSIFEQWASDDGITDRLSGDTLKTALERGSQPSSSPSK